MFPVLRLPEPDLSRAGSGLAMFPSAPAPGLHSPGRESSPSWWSLLFIRQLDGIRWAHAKA